MIEDSMQMQLKFGMLDKPLTLDQLKFRVRGLMQEEMTEALDALTAGDAEELVDAHIDLIVIALGNLHLMGVNVQDAWNTVHLANMTKVRGVKPGREESGGFDLMKPFGWKKPDHTGNHGVLDGIFQTTPAP